MIPWRELLGGLCLVAAILCLMAAAIYVAALAADKVIRYADGMDEREAERELERQRQAAVDAHQSH